MKNKVPLILPPLLAILASPAYGQLTQSEANQAVGLAGSCLDNWDCLTSEEYLLNEGSESLLARDAMAGHYGEEAECECKSSAVHKAVEYGGAPAGEYGLPYSSLAPYAPPAQYILTEGVGNEAGTLMVYKAAANTLENTEAPKSDVNNNGVKNATAIGATGNDVQGTEAAFNTGFTEGGEVNEVSQAISARPALLEGVYEYRQENSNKKLALGSNSGARAVLIASAAPKPSTKPPKKPHPVIRKIRTVCTFMQPIVSVAVGVLTILLLLL